MITIIESGSTKADWLIIDENQRFQHHTMGFNPFFHSSEYVSENLHHWIDLIQKEMGAKPVPTYPEGLMRFLAIFGDILSTIGVKSFGTVYCF